MSAPSARPGQRSSAGVRDSRAAGPCMHDAADLGEHAARPHVRDRPSARASSTRARSRPRRARTRRAPRPTAATPTHAATAASSSSRCSARLSNVANRASSPRPSSVQHAVRDRLGRRRDRDPPAVGAAVRAARHRVRDPRTEPRLLVAEVRGGRRQRRHHLHHRLEQVHVDHLTLAGPVAVAQRDHHRERAARAPRPRR